jgi:pimeloyl-ACP methyl ester carboxylesterase
MLQGVVSKDVDAVVAALKAKGITKFASIGWCWGASMAAQAAAADPADFKATAFLHPSMFGQEKELVGKLRCPLASFSAPGGKLLHGYYPWVPCALAGFPAPLLPMHLYYPCTRGLGAHLQAFVVTVQ